MDNSWILIREGEMGIMRFFGYKIHIFFISWIDLIDATSRYRTPEMWVPETMMTLGMK